MSLGLGMLAAVHLSAILMGQSPVRSRQILTMGLACVLCTGTGRQATVGHGWVCSQFMISKEARDTATWWDVYHAHWADKYLRLNSTAQQFTGSAFGTIRPNSLSIYVGRQYRQASGDKLHSLLFRRGGWLFVLRVIQRHRCGWQCYYDGICPGFRYD